MKFWIILLGPLGFRYFGEFSFFFISKYSDSFLYRVYVVYTPMFIIQNLHQIRQIFRVTVGPSLPPTGTWLVCICLGNQGSIGTHLGKSNRKFGHPLGQYNFCPGVNFIQNKPVVGVEWGLIDPEDQLNALCPGDSRRNIFPSCL